MNNTNNRHPARVWSRYVYTCAFLVITSLAFADNLGFNFINNKRQTTIGFKLIGNLIVIPVRINDQMDVNLVLDTGGRSLVLFGKNFQKMLTPVPGKEIRLSGYGSAGHRLAKLSLNNTVSVSPDIQGTGIGIILTTDKYFFPDDPLTTIHGIIGYQIFSRFVVKIDYPNRLITLSEPFDFTNLNDRYKCLNLVVKDTKPYVQASLDFGTEKRDAFFHIDTGSSRKLILFLKNGDELVGNRKLYRCSVGKGLNGNISGFKAKDLALIVANDRFEDVDPYILERKFSDRELQEAAGTIGSAFLKDFVIVMDYVHQKFYYKKVSG